MGEKEELTLADEPTLDVILEVDAVDEEIPMAYVIELYQKKLSYPEIAAIVGCSPQNIHQRLQRVRGHIDALPAIKEQNLDMLRISNHKALSELMMRDYKDVSTRDIAWIHGVGFDKQRLAEDKSTANIAHVHEGLTTKISDLEKRIAENRAQLGMMPEEGEDEDGS